jgi:hypothetical protein
MPVGIQATRCPAYVNVRSTPVRNHTVKWYAVLTCDAVVYVVSYNERTWCRLKNRDALHPTTCNVCIVRELYVQCSTKLKPLLYDAPNPQGFLPAKTAKLVEGCSTVHESTQLFCCAQSLRSARRPGCSACPATFVTVRGLNSSTALSERERCVNQRCC